MRQGAVSRIARMLGRFQGFLHLPLLQVCHGGKRVGIRCIFGLGKQGSQYFQRLLLLVALQQETGAHQIYLCPGIRAGLPAFACLVEQYQCIEKAVFILCAQGFLHRGSGLQWLILSRDKRQSPQRSLALPHGLLQ